MWEKKANPDGQPRSKCRRLMPIALPAVVGTPVSPITIESSDDSDADAPIPKVINNEIVSFSYCYLDGCMMMMIFIL